MKKIVVFGDNVLIRLKKYFFKRRFKYKNYFKLKNKETIEIASMVKHKVSTNSNVTNYIKYINLSVVESLQGQALIASMVKHSSNKRGLHRHLVHNFARSFNILIFPSITKSFRVQIPGQGVPANFLLDEIFWRQRKNEV